MSKWERVVREIIEAEHHLELAKKAVLDSNEWQLAFALGGAQGIILRAWASFNDEKP